MSHTATRTTTTGGQSAPDDVQQQQYAPSSTPTSGTYTQDAGQYNQQQSGKLAPITTAVAPNRMSRVLVIAKLAGIGLIVAALVYTSIQVYYWSVDQYNTYHYGPTRTYATTAVLGLNSDSQANPSDVAIINFRGNMTLLIAPAGDVTNAQTYGIGYRLIGDGVSKTPATITFAPNTTTKKPDIIIHIAGQPQTIRFVSTGSGYVIAKQ